MSYLGVDLGTNGVKLTLISSEGSVIQQQSGTYSPTYSEGCRAEIDPARIWSQCSELIAQVILDFKTCDPVQSLAFSVLGEAVTPVDRSGHPLANTLVSMDYRGQHCIERLAEQAGSLEVYRQTGQTCHPMYPVSKILWWRENDPDLFRRVWKFLCWEEYLSYKLTGKAMMSHSLASRTLLFNPQSRQWASEMMEVTGISEEMLPGLIPSGKPVGTLRPASLDRPGIPETIVLVSGGWDQACAALGAGVATFDSFLVSLGTTICVGSLVDRPVISEKLLSAGYPTNCYLMEESYLINGGTLDGGELLNWYQNTIQHDLSSQTTGCTQDFFQHCLESLDLTPSSLVFLPFFSGSGTPTLDPALRGSLLGLSYQSTSQEILKALVEGLCSVIKHNVTYLEEVLEVEYREVRFVGGGSRSNYISTLLATMLEKPVITFDFSDLASYGAAILAMAGIEGWEKSLNVLNGFLSHARCYTPDSTRVARYRESQNRYLTLTEAIKPVLKRLTQENKKG